MLVHKRESDVIPDYPTNYKDTMYKYGGERGEARGEARGEGRGERRGEGEGRG
jgi:hypothetical protein